MTTHAPSFTAARLYKKTSAKGGTYFTGRMGGVKVALLKSKDTAENGDEIWNLVFGEVAPYQPKDATSKLDSIGATAPAPAERRSASRSPSAMRDFARPPHVTTDAAPRIWSGPDAEIPF